MSKPAWEMVVPVISWAHAPNENFAKELNSACEGLCIAGPIAVEIFGGVFVFVGDPYDVVDTDPEWYRNVLAWMVREYPGETWLRFDVDGDVIEELPVYEW